MNWAQCTLYRLQLKRVGWGPDSSHVNEIESMTLLFKGLPLHAEDDSHLFEASRLWVCMDCNVCINEIPLKRLNLAAINSEQNRFYVATGNALMVYNSLCPEQSVYPASYYRLNHPYPRFADDRFATDYSPAPFNSICSGRIFDWEVVAACDDAGQVVLWWWTGGEEVDNVRWSLLTPPGSEEPWDSAWSLAIHCSVELGPMLACGTNACVVWLWHLPRQLADSSYLVAKTFPVFVDNDEHSPPTTATITSLPPDNVICLRGHSSNVPAVEFSPCGRLLASCSIDSSVRLWCTLTGSCVQQISTSVREPVAELESRLWLWTVRFIPRDDTPQNTPTSDPLKVTTLHNQVLAEHPVSNNEPNGTEFSAQALRRYMLLYTSKYDIILYQDLCLPQSTSPTIGSLSEVISKVNDDPSTYTFDNATSHPVFSAYYRPNSQMPQSRVRAVLWSSYLWDGHIIFNQPLIDGRNGQTVGWLICDRLGAIALIRLKRVNNTTAADTVELVQIKGEWINDTINWDSRQAKEGERIIATDQRPSASPTEMELVRSGLYALRSFANPVIGVFTSFHGRSDSVEEPHFNIYTVYADGSLTCIQFFMADFKCFVDQ